MVQRPKCLYRLDDRINADPTVVDFHRKLSEIKHAALGYGPHICPGNVLARRELILFLEEGMHEIPDSAVDPHRHPDSAQGSVTGCDQPHLHSAARTPGRPEVRRARTWGG